MSKYEMVENAKYVNLPAFFSLPFPEWLKNCSVQFRTPSNSSRPKAALFLSAIWFLWKDRNALVFRAVRSRPQDLCSTIIQHANYTELAKNPLCHAKPQLPRWIRWIPPAEGFCKLNSDGSYSSVEKAASAGGLIRDSLGNWLIGFTVNIGHASIFIAELWGMRAGLRLCRELGFTRVIAEMDSLMAVRFVNERREPDNLAAALLSDIRDLMAQFESCMLQHVLREGNAAADFLASLGHTSPPGLSILDSPPTGLRPILLGDQMGASSLRL
ncbi:hypothetical protein SLEP1_g16396 [Rubroshorea leprosula]|uniref:RNase H type-1 domain-containing protein n=2 Tax=Rubroshorea leprosula TaxID=152421 RepID=A0AAV5IQN8_9ROSI|nr:hypothetical protein SLEP1_g16396 [Rubroshorea leprosula]